MLVDALAAALRPLPFRGKYRLLRRLAPDRGERTIRLFGMRMPLDLGEDIQRWIYMGIFEPEETARVRGWLRPGMTFVDVGANVGYFTALAASLVGPTGRVFAMEPSPYAFGRLAALVRANGLSQVTPGQFGLGDEPGELDLHLPPASSRNHSPTMVFASEGQSVRVPVRRLDDCLDEWGVAVVDLIKVDVEGFEAHVFRGAARSLASGRIRAVLCEFNDFYLRQAGSSPRALYEMLLEAGFEDPTGPAEFAPGSVVTLFLTRRPAARP